jgi:hypothetical protein
MSDLTMTLAVAGFALAGLAILLWTGLKGWQGWLELKRLELSGAQAGQARGGVGERIEVADLRERIRKLESIAACIDL